MTYHIEPWVEKIASPLVLVYPGGDREEYRDGREVRGHTFSEHYRVKNLQAVADTVEIVLEKPEQPDIPSFF